MYHMIFCSQNNGDAIGWWNCDTQILIDGMGREARCATVSQAHAKMVEWSWTICPL
jgi:hypothetical protein